MGLEFGNNVVREAEQLADSGKDANQIAKILCEKDEKGHNYGIGIILDGAGNPMKSSSALTEYAQKELESSTLGTYMNTAKLSDQLKQAVLKWQRIPEKYWDRFLLALPSDAGTGAVKTGVEVNLMLKSELNTLGIEKLGWPAYKAIAKAARVDVREFPSDQPMDGDQLLPVYQAGPMNTTGQVQSPDVITQRAKQAAQKNQMPVLDRAYSGFEFARLLEQHSYDEIMKMSFERQIEPFIAEGVTFTLAISPTKAFVTFAFRPCGFLLVYCPEKSNVSEVTPVLNAAIRARGSAFEHPITRALVKCMINDRVRLEKEHQIALERLADAEKQWARLVKNTPIEPLFSEQYAGLFRNPRAKENAAQHIYEKHIYPVLAKGRCRLNASGIPVDEQLAREHVTVFAEQCFIE